MNSAFDKTIKLDLILSAIDWLTFNVVLITCSLLHVWPFYSYDTQFLKDIIVSNVAYLIAQQIVQITLHHRLSQPATVFSNASRTAIFYTILNAALLGMLHYHVPGPWRSLLMCAMVFIVIVTERMLLRQFIKRKRSLGRNRVNTVIIGNRGLTQEAADVMTNQWNGYNLLGYFADNVSTPLRNKTIEENVPHLGSINAAVDFIKRNNVAEVYIGLQPENISCMSEILDVCEKNMVRIYFIPVVSIKGIRKTRVRDFGDIYVMAQYNEPLRDVRNRFKKRLFDICVSLLFLCTLFPIILVVVAIVSKITMPGPLFFKQKRTGYDGREFYCYKFRSMKVNKDSDKVQAVKDDPRITKWGSFMRHTNIDELPQFINVLKGDMSLVGPRPHMLAHTDYYSQLISDYMIRHYVKPGITGWAQTHGERGETKTVQDMERRVIKDIWYIEHWGFWLDIQIMFKTIKDAVHGDEKAY